jgi:hypothetical protein
MTKVVGVVDIFLTVLVLFHSDMRFRSYRENSASVPTALGFSS